MKTRNSLPSLYCSCRYKIDGINSNKALLAASQQSLIDDDKAQQKAQIKQRYARMGRDPNYDSAAQQEMANVDIQAASNDRCCTAKCLVKWIESRWRGTAGPARRAILAGYNADQNAQKQQQEFLKTLARDASNRWHRHTLDTRSTRIIMAGLTIPSDALGLGDLPQVPAMPEKSATADLRQIDG
jgi:hypothetical protein